VAYAVGGEQQVVYEVQSSAAAAPLGLLVWAAHLVGVVLFSVRASLSLSDSLPRWAIPFDR
jgi:hypothetical protein